MGAIQKTGSHPELTLEQYKQAWDLFNGGQSPKAIRRIVGLTGREFFQLYRYGLPASGSRKAQPGFESRLAVELAEFRKKQKRAARSVSSRAVRVLDNATKNAEAATVVASLLLQLQAEKLRAELAKPEKDRDLEAAMLTEKAQAMLRSVRLYQDLTRPAVAFRSIFGSIPVHSPAGQAALGESSGKGSGTKGGDEAPGGLPAALAMLADVDGEETSTALSEEIMREIASWSLEEREAFAETGSEPEPPEPPDENEDSEGDDDGEDDDEVMGTGVVIDTEAY